MGKIVFFKLIDTVWGIISIIPFLLSIGGFCSSCVHPDKNIDFYWLGLLLPLFLVINLFLACYWVIRRKLWFIFPLMAILLNLPYISAVVQWPCKKSAPLENPIRIATYNMKYGKGDGFISSGSIMEELKDKGTVEVFCLQEFPASDTSLVKQFLDTYSFLPYHVIHDGTPDYIHTALFSRFPIIDFHSLSLHGDTKNTALYADLNVHGDTVRVFNLHLQTTGLNYRTRSVMEENSKIRARQADQIRLLIDESPFPVIVTGDFNDTPASYTYGAIKGSLKDSFSVSGKGFDYTYRHFWKLFRIDYVLYSPDHFKAIRYHSPDVGYSDHKPVIVTLNLISSR